MIRHLSFLKHHTFRSPEQPAFGEASWSAGAQKSKGEKTAASTRVVGPADSERLKSKALLPSAGHFYD